MPIPFLQFRVCLTSSYFQKKEPLFRLNNVLGMLLNYNVISPLCRQQPGIMRL